MRVLVENRFKSFLLLFFLKQTCCEVYVVKSKKFTFKKTFN